MNTENQDLTGTLHRQLVCLPIAVDDHSANKHTLVVLLRQRRAEAQSWKIATPLHAHKKPGFGLRVSSFLFFGAPSRLLISFLISYISISY